jgi:hypothetical protein
VAFQHFHSPGLRRLPPRSGLARTLGVTSHTVKVPDPYRSYPPGWRTFNTHAHVPGPGYLGLGASLAEVNRFAARYRAAKCFKGVEFEELTSGTKDGYTALIQTLLTFSAFEHLLRCIGLRMQDTQTLLSSEERDRALTNLRRLHGQREFFEALRQHLDPPYQRQVDVHLREEPCNPVYLAAAIRHAFAHGKLAATPIGAPENSSATVARFLCRVMTKIMDREFLHRVQALEE